MSRSTVRLSASEWIAVGVASVVAPTVLVFVSWYVLAMAVGRGDLAYGLRVSEEAASAILFTVGGVLAGLVVGLLARIRGWRLVVPSLAGAIAGLAVFFGLLVQGTAWDEIPWWAVTGAQTLGIVLATMFTPKGGSRAENSELPTASQRAPIPR